MLGYFSDLKLGVFRLWVLFFVEGEMYMKVISGFGVNEV